ASSPTKGGPQPRVSSPVSGGSTLITSAPRSARSMVQYGPARTREKSSTRRPLSGRSAWHIADSTSPQSTATLRRMRWFEDFAVGDTFELGATCVTREQIIGFAQEWDAQAFHVDEEAAVATPFGGLVASGWHTVLLFMQLYVEGVLRDTATVGSPGVERLRWLSPVRPGDVLMARATIVGARMSEAHSWRGTLRVKCEMMVGTQVVMSMIARALVRRRGFENTGVRAGS